MLLPNFAFYVNYTGNKIWKKERKKTRKDKKEKYKDKKTNKESNKSSHGGRVGSAFASRSKGRGFESPLGPILIATLS